MSALRFPACIVHRLLEFSQTRLVSHTHLDVLTWLIGGPTFSLDRFGKQCKQLCEPACEPRLDDAYGALLPHDRTVTGFLCHFII